MYRHRVQLAKKCLSEDEIWLKVQKWWLNQDFATLFLIPNGGDSRKEIEVITKIS